MGEATKDTDFSKEEHEARMLMRKMVLDLGNEPLKEAYYSVLLLAEHEAARREREHMREGSKKEQFDAAWDELRSNKWTSITSKISVHDARLLINAIRSEMLKAMGLVESIAAETSRKEER